MIIDTVREKINVLAIKIDSLNLRERGLVLAVVLVVTYVLWNNLVFGVFFPSDEEILRSTQMLREKITALQDQITGVSKTITGEQQILARVKQLKTENEKLKNEITEETKKMVSPKDMLTIVKNLINDSQRLTVLSVKSVPPRALFPELAQNNIANIYVHEINVELSGQYFDLLNFLKTLEAKNMKMIWNALSYEVKKYPEAVVRIKLQTLSTDAGWIGV